MKLNYSKSSSRSLRLQLPASATSHHNESYLELLFISIYTIKAKGIYPNSKSLLTVHPMRERRVKNGY